MRSNGRTDARKKGRKESRKGGIEEGRKKTLYLSFATFERPYNTEFFPNQNIKTLLIKI
jgi:hypothetical protein